ncbi:uncharacterized protein LOC127812287 [Diospyros lotus]|uniref:uncharacterized protein LOC127812287 n=1 Tax=Diospyros lotus TaxID=55363 RepID=UPI002251AB1E|nr:uncharacterized protein LOC127812287 [Diospyros lotus]
MEVAMELEDDVFYADLKRQISLLIMDDDDEDPAVHCPSVSLQLNFQACSRAIHPAAEPYFSYQQAGRRESKGTGVFIPQSSHPRRKNRQGRFSSSSNKKFQRHHSDGSRGLPNSSFTNNPSPNSFNSKIF